MRSGRQIATVASCLAAIGLLVVGSGASPAASRSHCTGATARAAVTAFIHAFNRGDYEALDAMFADEPDFEWYSSGGPGRRLGSDAKRRENLDTYFRTRHRVDDRLGLVSFDFNGDSGRYGNAGLTLRRSTAHFRHGDWFQIAAKGALICAADSTQLIVMTLGEPQPRPQHPA
jgi:hypothetical protein